MDGRLVRLRLRVSQRLLARVAGISQTTIVRIETGCQPVSQVSRDRYDDAIRVLAGDAAPAGSAPESVSYAGGQ